MIARYFRLHFANCRGALGRIGSSPVGALLNVLVIAIALALPTAMQILIANATSMAPAFEDAADFTVYLADEVDATEGQALTAELAGRDDVESARFVSRDDGLADLKSWVGFGDALDGLGTNPLPHVIRLRPAGASIDEIDALAAALEGHPATASVQVDRLWVERLQAILGLGHRAVNLITIVLAAAVVLVIGNTIRLEINNRHTEIEVLKLVGATDGFIRRPFLYTGFWLGTLGALAAALVIGAGLWLLARPVRELAALYASDFALSGLGPGALGLLVGGGAVLGWAGAWIAAARHLRAIEPA